MPQSIARVRQTPHFRVAASELAAWLDAQGEDSWWSVDGDPLLTERVNFPCPADDLAKDLRRFKKTLLMLDTREPPTAHGQSLSSAQLDGVAYTDQHGDRVFQLCWEDGPDVDWLLIEDKEMARISRGLDDRQP